MTRSRSSGGNAPHSIPSSLPADGTPYTVVTTTTHQKKLGDSPMNQQQEPQQRLTQADFEDSHWNVYIQTSKGFEFAEKLKGKPYDSDIRDLFGPGLYQSTPIGPDGRPVTSMTVTHKVLDPTEAMGSGKPAVKNVTDASADPAQWKGEEKMPAWMRYQLQHAAEDRSEARRRAEEAELRKDDWERQQRDREWQKMEREAREERERRESESTERRDRYEREERERKERDDRERLFREEKEQREREERRHRSDQFAAMMGAATTVVTSFLESKNSRDNNSRGKDLNEVLLQAIVADKKTSNTSSMADQIEILLALDQLRKNDAPAPVEKEDDGSDIMKMLAGAAPLLAAMKGGGGVPPQQHGHPQMMQQAALPPQPDPHALAAQALQDPEVVSRLAMQNPTGVAASLVQAVKGNPLLKNAVVKAFEQGGE